MRSNRWGLALGFFNPVALVHAVDTVTVHIPTGSCLPGAYTGLGGSGLPKLSDTIESIYGTYSLQGCYDASAGGYVVTSVTTNTSLTLEGCAASCQGSSYLAVANGNTCICASSGPTGAGVDIGQYGCQTTCTGNNSQCGGSARYGLVYHCPTCKVVSGSSTAITLTTPSTSIVVYPTTDSAGSSTTSLSTSTIPPSSTSSTSAVTVITSTGTATSTDSKGSSITSISTVTTSSTKTGGKYSTVIPTSHASCKPGIYEDALGQVYEIYCGTDIPGKDLLTPNKDSFADCLLECDRYVPSPNVVNNAACIGVSYGYGNVGGNCYLKYAIDTFNTGNGGFDSARMIGYNPPGASSVSLSPPTAGPSILPTIIAPVSSIVGEVTSAIVAPVTSLVGEVTSAVVAPVTSVVGEVTSAVVAPVTSVVGEVTSVVVAPVTSLAGEVTSAVVAPVSSILSSVVIAPVYSILSSAIIAPVSSAVIAPVSSAVVAPISSILSTAVVAPISSAVVAPVSSAVVAPVSSALSSVVPAPISSIISSAVVAPISSISVPVIGPIGGLGEGGGGQQTPTGPVGPVDTAALTFPCPAYDGAQYIDPNGETYQVECNTNYPGSDLPAVHKDTFKDCITACDTFVPNNYGSCIGVSWGVGNVGGNCYLKFAITQTLYNQPGFESAHKVSYQKPGQSNTPVASVPLVTTTRLPVSTPVVSPPVSTPVVSPPVSTPVVSLPVGGGGGLPIGGGGGLPIGGGGGGQSTTSQTPASTSAATQGPGPTPTITTITGCPANNNTRYTNNLGTTYDVRCGFELVGRNGKPAHADSFEKCLEFCDILHGCAGVTYLDPPPPAGDSNCYPYAEVTSFARGRDGVFTGVPINGPTNNPVGTGVLCPGSNGGSFTDVFGETYRIGCGYEIGGDNLYATQTWTLQGCLTYCSTYNTCKGVVFVGQENPPQLPADQNANCYPKSSIVPPLSPNGNTLLAVNSRFVPAGF